MFNWNWYLHINNSGTYSWSLDRSSRTPLGGWRLSAFAQHRQAFLYLHTSFTWYPTRQQRTVGAEDGACGKPTPHNDFGNAKFNAKCGRACFRLFCFRLLLSFFRGIWTLMLLLLLGLLFSLSPQVWAFVALELNVIFHARLERRINCG